MRPFLFAILLLLAPVAAAFPIESGVVIEQGNARFYLAEGVTLDTGVLTFAGDGAPIYDTILLGFTSSGSSEWTIQEISSVRVVLNGTPTAPGAMRFSGYPAYEVSGVAGKHAFEREGSSSWSMPSGAQTIVIGKTATTSQRLSAAMANIVGVVLALFLVGLVIMALARLATKQRS